MREGIVLYVEKGVLPGGFLKALFSNDLMEACARADAENIRLLPSYARLLWGQCPSGCFGNPELVRLWIARGGLRGNDKHEPLPVHKWSRWADQTY
jgi:hypothetical protein